MQKPLAYLILGTPGSGRREVIADLIAESFESGDKVSCLVSDAETASTADERLAKLSTVGRWTWTDDKQVEGELPEGTRILFFFTDGRSNPIDQIEAFRTWLRANDCELGRIYTVVDCGLAHSKAGTLPWFDACIHFSDAALLNRRDGVPNKWMSDFIARYGDQCYPCLFELVRQGKVKNPAMILDPQARRISQAFEDIPEDGFGNFVISDEDGEDEDEDDEEDDLEGGESPDEDEEPSEDPYFVRKPGGGRVRSIPDITQFLSS